MKNDVRKQADILLKKASELWKLDGQVQDMDPVIKLLFSALVYETLQIRDQIDASHRQIASVFRDATLPYHLISAQPAFSIIQARLDAKQKESYLLNGNVDFVYEKEVKQKGKTKPEKQLISFKPVADTAIIPAEVEYQFIGETLFTFKKGVKVPLHKSLYPCEKEIWLGLKTAAPLQDLNRASIFFDIPFISETTTYLPEISLTAGEKRLQLVHSSDLEQIDISVNLNNELEADRLAGGADHLRKMLIENALPLYYIRQPEQEKEPLKQRHYPDEFKSMFPESVLSTFTNDLLWLKITFHSGVYYLVDKEFDVLINTVPVLNIEKETVTLTENNPIVKLPKNDYKQFLGLLNHPAQDKFSRNPPFILRNFDVERFNPEDLKRQIERLYDRFSSDYYAFKGLLSEGKEMNDLHKAMNELYHHFSNAKSGMYAGYYAMLTPNSDKKHKSIPLPYLCTDGEKANGMKSGEKLTVKNAFLAKEALCVVTSYGGRSEATENEREYITRYQSLTQNKLVTKEDMKAFCRKELGDKLQSVQVSNGAINTPSGLSRGIIVKISLVENEPQEYAYLQLLAHGIRKKIENLSTGVFPVEVRIH